MAFFRKSYFRAKTASVLEATFGYRYGAIDNATRQVFNSICDRTPEIGGNEYDAAIIFMLLQRKRLEDNARLAEANGSTDAWINYDSFGQKWLLAAQSILPLAIGRETRALFDREAGL